MLVPNSFCSNQQSFFLFKTNKKKKLKEDKGLQTNAKSLDEGKRIAVRLAFYVHTQLNAQMSPLLGEFLQKTLR